ncbi:PAS domain S-box protein [Ketobacter sp.]|uniref:PAS domain S-box protein n=1 Tax=Ketobacter sp. TaxID=2083498 RepID=UPI000F161878|nr:PAS domain S-box protein [Ketobacter sp.]RLT92251.1 MAG: PAS domain S-box protein [Ketobacter sp.]
MNQIKTSGFLNAIALAAIYALLAAFCYGVASTSDCVAIVWLPASVAIAWVLRAPLTERRSLYFAIFLANSAVAWLYGGTWWCMLGCSLARVIGVMVAVRLVQTLVRDHLTVRDAAFILGGYVFVAAPVSALLGAAVVWLAQGVQWSPVLWDWWLGEVIGAALLLLPSLRLAEDGFGRIVKPRLLIALGLQLLGLFALSFFVLEFMAHPYAYLALPLMAIALVYGMLRVAVFANLVFLALGAGIAWGWWSFPVLLADGNANSLWAASAAVVFGPMILGLAIDEIRRRQTELTTLGERLELASKSVDLALWDWNVSSGEIYWDARMRQLYEIGDQDPPLPVEEWRQRLHPDDVAHAEGALQNALAGTADYKTEYRLVRSDGTYRSLQAAGIVIRNELGEPVRMVGLNWDVSELVSAQRAVKTAEAKLDSVIEAASEFSIIATDTEGLIEVFSAGAERLLGYSREEMVGKHSPAVFHVEDEVVQEGLLLTDKLGYTVAGFEVFIAQARAGKAVSKEWTYVRKDGKQVPVNLTVTIMHNDKGEVTGYLGVARNITQQKVAEREIRAAHDVLEQQIKLAQQMRDEFESLFELAPGAMLVLDGVGSVVNANSRAHQMFACDQTMLGRSVTRYLPGFTHYQPSDHGARGHNEQDWLAVRVDGSRFEALLEYSPLLLNGIVHTIVNVYDISEQKEAERSLQRSKDVAESANRAKTEFLANMSHEIRTPLNAVLGAAQLLSLTQLDKNQSNHVGMISAAGKALLALLNDVLDVSKIEAGKMELSHAPFSLGDVVEPLATIMSGTSAKKDLELVIDVDPAIPANLMGDALRLQQVLVNLTGNAIKFTEQGEVVVRFRLLERHEDSVAILVSVKDTGIGMDQEQQARLFNAFSQADTSITRRFGGTGLGLTICKKLVELMHGQISVHSAPESGSEFRCQLLLELDPNATAAAAPLAGKRILLADSNAASVAALTSWCEHWGWPCDSVGSLVELETRLAERAGDYDVLVSNQNLAGADGTERLQVALPHVKLVGNLSREELRRISMRSNKVVALSKPVTTATFLDAVDEACQRYTDQADQRKPVASKALTRLDGARLLLVEDTPSNQTIIVGVLEQVGAIVEVVNNGAEAVERLQTCGDPALYDAVLMDVQMPVMDGFTATQKIRGDLQLSVPIIAMTAGVLAFERKQCIDSGMNDFVDKPLDIPRMLETIARYVPQRAAMPLLQEKPPTAAAEDSPATIAGVFNPERIMSFVRGKPAREQEILAMIERIVTEGLQPLEEGRHMLEEEDFEGATRHFHTLKGTMGNFGADRVMNAAQALEQAIKQQQMDRWGTLLSEFQKALAEMVQVAAHWLVSYRAEKPAPAPAALDQHAFGVALEKLRDKLNHSNIEAVELFADLNTELAQRLGAERVAVLADAVEDLRFADAVAVLDELQAG